MPSDLYLLHDSNMTKLQNILALKGIDVERFLAELHIRQIGGDGPDGKKIRAGASYTSLRFEDEGA
jgi:hypothetical protein